MRVPKRAHDFRLGRLAARRALLRAGLAEQDLARLEVRARPDGSPEVQIGGEPARFSLSITHSSGWGLAACAEGLEVGVDLERVEARSPAFEEDYLTPRERADLPEDPVARARHVTLIWSAKESALKLLRSGLRTPLLSLEVELVGRAGPESRSGSLVVRLPGGSVAGAWWESEGLAQALVRRQALWCGLADRP
jgi:4'-phosphopantetheinyl transferase